MALVALEHALTCMGPLTLVPCICKVLVPAFVYFKVVIRSFCSKCFSINKGLFAHDAIQTSAASLLFTLRAISILSFTQIHRNPPLGSCLRKLKRNTCIRLVSHPLNRKFLDNISYLDVFVYGIPVFKSHHETIINTPNNMNTTSEF